MSSFSIDSAFDSKLMVQVASGDAKAVSKLFDRYAGLVYNLAARILKDKAEAEEVVQELFLRIWREAAKFDASRGEVKTWLVQMARTMAIDRLRSSASRIRREESYALERTESDTAEGELEEARLVKNALSELPDEERNLITAAYFEGLSQTELASRFGLPLGTVKSRIRQGMAKMRERLTPLLNI